MKRTLYISAKLKNEKGVTAVYVAIMLVVLIGMVAMAVDIGYMMVTKNELQNIADASALAGARMLGRLYECNGNIVTCSRPMSYEDQLVYPADRATITNAIFDVASQNQAGGKANITINDTDIVIGTWDAANKRISPVTNISPDAVQVTARRDSIANLPITTFFASLLGISTVNVSAMAIAALTGQSSSASGGLPLPVAINLSWIRTLPCNQNLTFHPSSAGTCAAWHSYDSAVYNNSESVKKGERAMIDALTAGTYSSPPTYAGETKYDFTNGTLASVFTSTAIQDLFNAMKVKNDGILDRDEDPTTWTTGIPIFDDTVEGCSPNGLLTIVGFTTITITSVSGPPASTIYATVKCDDVVTGRGSGGNYGTKGSIPGLVY